MRKSTVIPFVIIAAVMTVFSFTSVHTGDDLGYMFADTVHHGGDGARVTDFRQIIATQCHHYVTTNGRFLTHVAVMTMLNLVPLWLYRVLNGVMIALLWLLMWRTSDPKGENYGVGAIALLGVTALLPQPGMVMFTLASYSVNYIWVGVAVLFTLLMIRRHPDSRWVCVLALVCATLQESYSLPVCLGLLILSLRRELPWRITACWLAGTAIVCLAPGCIGRFMGGGAVEGMSVYSANRLYAFLGEFVCSYLLWGWLVIALLLLAFRSNPLEFFRKHIFELSVVAGGFVLALGAFTSARQFTCPILFMIILTQEAAKPRVGEGIPRFVKVCACTVLSGALLIFLYPQKKHIHDRYVSMERRALSGAPVAWADGAPDPERCTDELFRPLVRGFLPDPNANIGIQTIGDGYTHRGLSRLSGKKVAALLPCPVDSLVRHARFRCEMSADSLGYKLFLTKYGNVSIAAIPSRIYKRSRMNGAARRQCESVMVGDSTYIVTYTAPGNNMMFFDMIDHACLKSHSRKSCPERG